MVESLVKSLLGERKIKKFLIAEGREVVLHSLIGSEISECDREVYTATPGAGFAIETNAYRVPVLSRSLLSVNGVALQNFPEVQSLMKSNEKLSPQQAIATVLAGLDSETLNVLYSLYLDLEKENQEEKQKQRNFSSATKGGSSGS